MTNPSSVRTAIRQRSTLSAARGRCVSMRLEAMWQSRNQPAYSPAQCLPSTQKLYTLRGVSAVCVGRNVKSVVHGISCGVTFTRSAGGNGDVCGKTHTVANDQITVTHLVEVRG